MGDRSVLYKYLNPNLAVIVTEGSDANAKREHLRFSLIPLRTIH